MKNSIKSALYTLTICLFTLALSSCSRGYGCPYNSSIDTERTSKVENIVFEQTLHAEEQIEVMTD